MVEVICPKCDVCSTCPRLKRANGGGDDTADPECAAPAREEEEDEDDEELAELGAEGSRVGYDCTLVCGGGERISCHRSMIAKLSPVLQEACEAQERLAAGTAGDNELEIPDAEHSTVQALVAFAYGSGVSNVADGKIIALLRLAERYNVKALIEACKKHCENLRVFREIPAGRFTLETTMRLVEQFGKQQAMERDELERKCKELGIPSRPRIDRAELLASLKEAALFDAMDVEGLQSECRSRGVGLPDLTAAGTVEEQRKQLVDMLMLNMCKSAFDSLDIPELGSFRACSKVAQMWALADAMSFAEQTAAYCARTRLPATGLDKTKVPARLKKIQLWEEMSLEALRQECKRHRLSSAGPDKKTLVSNLILGIWDVDGMSGAEPKLWQYAKVATDSGSRPARPSQRPGWGIAAKSGGGKGFAPPARAPPLPPGLAAEFQVLGLPVSAGAEEVKRAYKKLALKHHPDKNGGDAEEFKKVEQAYTKVSAYLSSKT